jgi:hypothetical protein
MTKSNKIFRAHESISGSFQKLELRMEKISKKWHMFWKLSVTKTWDVMSMLENFP